MDLPVIQDFIAGYKQGAATIDKDIEVQVIFIGSFNDAQKAYDLTKTAIGNGANVVYNVAGPAGLGILKAAADANKYAIGVDSDQNGLHPKTVIASMLKQIGNSIYDSIKQIRAGQGAVRQTGDLRPEERRRRARLQRRRSCRPPCRRGSTKRRRRW